ncbi:MAG: hypothetical protein CML86_00080 [Rhodobiaceae bacterium]|nr:hypothetical protein [Rhodobiaceae bacterium]
MTAKNSLFEHTYLKYFLLLAILNFLSISSAYAEAEHSQTSASFSNKELYPTGLEFNTDGDKMYITGTQGKNVTQYSLTTPFDVSTIAFEGETDSAGYLVSDVAFNSDGTKMFLVGYRDSIAEYNLGTPFDVRTASLVNDSHTIAGLGTQPKSFTFNDDGSRMFIAEDETISAYDLSISYDVSSAVSAETYETTYGVITGLVFNSDGSRIFTTAQDNDSVNEYAMPTAYNITDTVYIGSFKIDVNGEIGNENNPKGVSFNSDGTKMFALGFHNKQVYEYTMSCPFQVTSSSICRSEVSSDQAGLIDAQIKSSIRLAQQTSDIILDRISRARVLDSTEKISSNIGISFTNPEVANIANILPIANLGDYIPFQGSEGNDWSTWINADITVGEIDETGTSSSQEILANGLSLGFDKRLSSNKLFGLSMRIATDRVDIGSEGTNISTQSVNMSVYGSYFADNDSFIDGLIGFGHLQSDIDRVSGAITTNGDREGSQIFGSLKFGKKMGSEDVNIYPYGKIHTSFTQLDEYTEVGVDAIKFDPLSINSLSGSFGLELDKEMIYGDVQLVPRLKLEYAKEFSSEYIQDYYYTSDLNTNYSHSADNINSDIIILNLGFDVINDNGLTFSSSFKREERSGSESYDTFSLSTNYLTQDDSKYSLSLQGSEADLTSSIEVSKGLDLFDLNAQFEYDVFAPNTNKINISAIYNF